MIYSLNTVLPTFQHDLYTETTCLKGKYQDIHNALESTDAAIHKLSQSAHIVRYRIPHGFIELPYLDMELSFQKPHNFNTLKKDIIDAFLKWISLDNCRIQFQGMDLTTLARGGILYYESNHEDTTQKISIVISTNIFHQQHHTHDLLKGCSILVQDLRLEWIAIKKILTQFNIPQATLLSTMPNFHFQFKWQTPTSQPVSPSSTQPSYLK